MTSPSKSTKSQAFSNNKRSPLKSTKSQTFSFEVDYIPDNKQSPSAQFLYFTDQAQILPQNSPSPNLNTYSSHMIKYDMAIKRQSSTFFFLIRNLDKALRMKSPLIQKLHQPQAVMKEQTLLLLSSPNTNSMGRITSNGLNRWWFSSARKARTNISQGSHYSWKEWSQIQAMESQESHGDVVVD